MKEPATQTKTPEPASTIAASPGKIVLSHLSSTHPILRLQRAIGNQAVLHHIQAKLTVGGTHDVYEQEADRVADQIVSTEPVALLQRKCACGGIAGSDGECAECSRKRVSLQRQKQSTEPVTGHNPNDAPPIVHEVLRSPGQPLDKATRNFMEPRFGTDFSQVRIHTDRHAQESARAIQARAYTVGQTLVFGAGEYMPETPEGRRLLAHELTHVEQQRGVGIPGGSGTIQRQVASPAGASGSLPSAKPSTGIAPTTSASSKDKAVKPPAPKGELVVNSETNVTFTDNIEYVRYQLQTFVAINGSDRLGVFETGLYRFGSGLGPLLEPPPKPATDERTRYLERVVKLVQSEVKALRLKMAGFLSDFERRAVDKLLEMLDASKARIEKERQRYDVKKEDSGHSVETGKETEDLTRRARDLLGKQAAVVTAKAELESAQPYGPHGELPPGGAPSQEEQDKETAARDKFTEVQRVYNLARAEAERRHPILISYQLDPLGPITAETLGKLGSTSSSVQAETLAAEINNKLDNIETVRKRVLGDWGKVWELYAVVEATKTYPDIQSHPGLLAGVRSTVLAEKAGALQAEAELTTMFTGVAMVIVGLVAAVPTGGLSLGAAAVVSGAGVAEAGLMAFTAYQATERFRFDLAASGTDFDKAKAISQEEPSLFWLALDIIGAAVVSLPHGLTLFRKLVGLRRMAVAAKAAGRLSEAEEILNAIKKEGDEIGHAGLGTRLTKDTEELAAARVKHGPEFEEIQQNLGKKRPSTLPGYSEEIPLDAEGKHFWRKSADRWCRFSDSPMFCFEGGSIEGRALEEQLHVVELDETAREGLRKNLGPPPKMPGKWQAHHIIPIEEYDQEVIAFIRERTGWDINAAENGVWLPEQAEGPLKGGVASHLGPHPTYTYSIGARLNNLIPEIEKVNANIITAGELRNEVEQIVAEYRAKFISEFKGIPLK